MTSVSEITEHWFGLCRKAPALRTAPAVLMVPQETMRADRPDSSGSDGGSGRIRLGVIIAAGSLKTIVRNRYLLGFSLLSGFVMFFLNIAEVWDATHFYDTLPFPVIISIGNVSMVFDPWFFLAEMICLFCFTLLLAGLVLHRNGNRVNAQVAIREGFTGAGTYAGPFAVLSIALALIATIGFEIVTNSQLFSDITSPIFCVFFWIPYVYILGGMAETVYLACIIMFINIIPFLVALCLVPVIVLEKKGFIPALAGSINLIQRTWREILGCVLVYGTIVLLVAAVALVIGQVPQLLIDHGIGLSMYLGHMLLTVVYYGFILACLILMGAGFSAAGVAVAKLYRIEECNGISGKSGGNMKETEPAS